MSLNDLLQSVANATGSTVIVGCQPFKSDYFAHAEGVEYWGSTPEEALESVAEALLRNRHAAHVQALADARKASEGVVALSKAMGVEVEP